MLTTLAVSAERALARAEWPLAARQYTCATQHSDDVALAERATRTAYDNLQLANAVADARRWLELVPDSEVARRYLATGLLRLYDDGAAAQQFADTAEYFLSGPCARLHGAARDPCRRAQ